MCWADTQVKPIEAEDHAIGLVKYENGAIGQFEVSWTFRGGLDLRDEVMGTEGTIWINNFLRTGLEMFTTGKGADYVAEKAESNTGWLFPVGDELNDLGYNHMFTDMFNAMEKGTAPKETFYDGYVVNAVLDAAYKSAKTKLGNRFNWTSGGARQVSARQSPGGIRCGPLPCKRRNDALWREKSNY